MLPLALLYARASLDSAPFSGNSSSDSILSTSECSCPDTRSIVGIVWSCLATVFLCTWVSVHPNVPPAGEHPVKTALRRLKIMLYGVLGPEMILIWAVKQWFAARVIAKDYEKHGWTTTHGFFLLMGGFVLVKDNEDMGTISPALFRELCDAEDIQFPSLTADEINDKSKGDFISKGLVVLQTLWFIVQCIARAVQGLAVTELEIVTLAFCCLNAMLYFFWWHKPLDIQCRAPVYLKSGSEYVHKLDLRRAEEIPNAGRAHLVVEEALDIDTPVATNGRSTSWIRRTFWSLVHPVTRKVNHQFKRIKNAAIEDLHTHNIFFVVLIRWPILVPFLLIIKVIALCYQLMRIMAPSGNDPRPGANRVETFYTPETEGGVQHIILVLFGIVGTIVGGLHCIAWNFHFPTTTERILWHTFSVYTAAFPSAAFICLYIVAIPAFFYCDEGETMDHCLSRYILRFPLERNTSMDWLLHHNLAQKLVYGFKVFTISFPLYIMAISAVLYVPSRLVLFFEAFFLLREVPPTVLLDVNWSRFIPHL